MPLGAILLALRRARGSLHLLYKKAPADGGFWHRAGALRSAVKAGGVHAPVKEMLLLEGP